MSAKRQTRQYSGQHQRKKAEKLKGKGQSPDQKRISDHGPKGKRNGYNDHKVRRKLNQRNFQGQSQTPEGKGKNLKLRNQERRKK